METERLSLTERIIRRVVAVIRHPAFVAAYTLGTAYWWASHTLPGGWAAAFRDDAYPWPMWTSLASLLALWIESSVGISQYHQQRRDSAMAAAMRAQSDAILTLLQRSAKRDAETAAALREIRGAQRTTQALVDQVWQEVTKGRAGRRESPHPGDHSPSPGVGP